MKTLFACLLLAAFAISINASPVPNKLDKDDINALLEKLEASQDDTSEDDGDSLPEILVGRVKHELAKEMKTNKKDAEEQGIFTSLVLGTLASKLFRWKLKDKQALLQELIDMDQEEVMKTQDNGDAESQWWWSAAVPLVKKYIKWKEQATLQEILHTQGASAKRN